MSKIIVAGNIKDCKQTKTGKTMLTIWDNYVVRKGLAAEQKSRTIVVWFEENLFHMYNAGDWIELEGEPSAKILEITGDDGQPKQVAMLHVNSPKVIQHVMDAKTKKEQAAYDAGSEAPF